jgi:V/A-type H+-transporting ATPase subunit I
MLRPERMKKLLIVGAQTAIDDVVSLLHNEKTAHIIEYHKQDYDLCKPLASFERVSNLLVQARSVMAHLQIEEGERCSGAADLDFIEDRLPAARKDGLEVIETIKTNESKKTELVQQKLVLNKLLTVGVSPEDFAPSEFIAAYFGTAGDVGLPAKIERLTDRVLTRAAERDGQVYLAIFIDKQCEKECERLLEEHRFSDIDLSIVRDLSGKTEDLLSSIEEQEGDSDRRGVETAGRLDTIRQKHEAFLRDAEGALAAESERAQAPLGFGSTEETFFLRCYVPARSLDRICDKLGDAAKHRISITEEVIQDPEEVPVKLHNPRGLGFFEFFTNLYSLPRYTEFDPTLLIAFTFPIFFGFMLGDMVYGAIIFALFWWLRRRFPAGHDFFTILMVAAVSTVLFGGLYGEALGFEPWHGLIVRTEYSNIELLLYVSIFAGVIQVNLGLVLGFILEWRSDRLPHAVYAKLSWILLQIGAFILYAAIEGMLPLPEAIGWGIIVLSLVLIHKAEGFIGVMEVPTLLSHILSYARLMAVGLASVFIAVMVNQGTTHFVAKGGIYLLLGALMFLFGHLFAIALGILSPSLHSIRLHYVEFFTKFYTGGGREYAPFGGDKPRSIF